MKLPSISQIITTLAIGALGVFFVYPKIRSLLTPKSDANGEL